MSKAQELVDYLNARIERTGYNERQCMANRVHFSLAQGPKYARIVKSDTQVDGMGNRSIYAFVDADGNIFKAAGWNRPAKGVRGNVSRILLNEERWFNSPRGFDQAPWSTVWLYM